MESTVARGSVTLAAPLLACLLVVTAAGASAGEAAGLDLSFPSQPTTLWFTAEPAPADASSPGAMLMVAEALGDGPAWQALLVPPAEQLGLGSHDAVWSSLAFSNTTREVAGDVAVDLHFSLGAHASGALRLQLHAVAPDGTLTLVAAVEQRVSVEATLPRSATFHLPATGAHIEPGHALRLTVSAHDLSVLTWLRFGSTEAPAALTVHHRPLDSDRDGIPDDHDPCPTEPDCDNDGNPDGGQTVYNNSTIVQQGPGGPGGGGGGNGGGAGAGNGTGPVTYHQYYLIGATPPTPPPGSPSPAAPALAERSNVELIGGGAMGAVGLLVALGGLFGRHPL